MLGLASASATPIPAENIEADGSARLQDNGNVIG
jgi:hypothetical protein